MSKGVSSPAANQNSGKPTQTYGGVGVEVARFAVTEEESVQFRHATSLGNSMEDNKDNVIDARKQFKKRTPPPKLKTPDEVLIEIKDSLRFIEDTVKQLVEAHEDTRKRTLYNNALVKWILQILVKCRIINLVDCPKMEP